MNDNIETGINHNTETQEETTVTNSNKTQEHSMADRSNKASELDSLREHILAGHYKEDIIADMELSASRFTNLYLRLLQKDKKFYEVAEKKSHTVKVGNSGSFRVTASIIESMGLGEFFKDGVYVNLERDGDRIIASVVTNKITSEKEKTIADESHGEDAPSFADIDFSVNPEYKSVYDEDFWSSVEPVDFNSDEKNPVSSPAAPIDEPDMFEFDTPPNAGNKRRYRSAEEYRIATGQEPPKVAMYKEDVE